MHINYEDEQLECLQEVNNLLLSKVGNVALRLPSLNIIQAHIDLDIFETVARTCYKSEDKIEEGSSERLYKRILKANHGAVLEFLGHVCVKLITDRGVTHEAVRMRLCSFAQESQRYVNYSGKLCQFIIPWLYTPSDMLEAFNNFWAGKSLDRAGLFLQSCISSSELYTSRISLGATPQEARGSLNNECKTELCINTNFREWVHIFSLRMDAAAHPNFRILMCALFGELTKENTEVFMSLPDSIRENMTWFHNNYRVVSFCNEITIVKSNPFSSGMR